MKSSGAVKFFLAVICVSVLFSAGGFCAETFVYPDDRNVDDNISFYEASSDTTPYPLLKENKVRNVIFCIGDGMGLSQVAFARLKAAGLDGKLYMERMPVTGIMRTHSANAVVTDSAAAGTALACGRKTNNKTIGMGAEGETCKSILEYAKAAGMRTGLVATSTISHATPASFGAHVESRYMEAKIAEHLLANRVNVLFGGGRQFWAGKGDDKSKRKDDRDLLVEAKQAGYFYVTDREGLFAAEGDYVLGLFQYGAMTTKEPEPSLEEMTSKAIELLDKPKKKDWFCENKGFFLMVEGSQIDWACHANNEDNTIRQTLLFDEAVRRAIDFALKDRQTLVIVTADHETGGLSVTDGKYDCSKINVKWTTKGHSGIPVIVYAFGPNALSFTGVYDNTDISGKIAASLGIKNFAKTSDN